MVLVNNSDDIDEGLQNWASAQNFSPALLGLYIRPLITNLDFIFTIQIVRDFQSLQHLCQLNTIAAGVVQYRNFHWPHRFWLHSELNSKLG